jgi:putative nucleotidyltransferase with HDIG domain
VPLLVMQEPSGGQRSVSFEARALLGREVSNDLRLSDPHASRHHAVVYRDAQGLYFVEDLASRNGVFMGERRIQRELLTQGQEFRIGSTVLRFELPPPEAGELDSLLLDPLTLTTETGALLPLLDSSDDRDDPRGLRRALRGLAALFELGNLLHGGSDQQALYEHIARLVVRTTGAELVSVAELDDELAHPRPRWVYPQGGLAGSGFTLSTTVTQQVLEEGRAVLVRDIEAFRDQHGAASLAQAPISAMICAPLRSLHAIRGIITAASCSPTHRFGAFELQLLTAIGLQAGIALESRGLYQQLEASFLGTVEALVNALDAKDEYTAGHARRVAELSEALACQLGLPAPEVRAIRLGALLHDIGKIGVPEAVLHAPRRLTDEEFALIQQHPVHGDNILRPLLASDHARAVVRNHHERWDGSGYPDGLAGEAIPFACRIVAVADTLDAITSRRPYRDVGAVAGALAEIERCAGSQFDGEVVRALQAVARSPGGVERVLGV